METENRPLSPALYAFLHEGLCYNQIGEAHLFIAEAHLCLNEYIKLNAVIFIIG